MSHLNRSGKLRNLGTEILKTILDFLYVLVSDSGEGTGCSERLWMLSLEVFKARLDGALSSLV